MEKTNVMRILDREKLEYIPHSFDGNITDGVTVAHTIGEDPARVFKTLVTQANTKEYFVFVIPVADSLDLKKAAKAVGVKSIAMIKQKELLPLTGYIHGGCSPIGMKKRFKTTLHSTAADFETIIFSAGKIGYQVEMSAAALCGLIGAQLADIIV